MNPAALHERYFTLDTHSDTPTASFAEPGWDFGARHDYTIDGSQCDLPRMREGGIDAMVFAVYVSQAARTAAGHAVAHDLALKHFERTLAVLQENRAACGLALTADDGLRFKAAGKSAIYLSIENTGYSHKLRFRGDTKIPASVWNKEGAEFRIGCYCASRADSETQPQGKRSAVRK